MPKWVISKIDRIRSFLWKGERDAVGGASLVKWDSVCTPKDEGGLGVLDLQAFNRALIAKWWWRLQTEPERLWAKLINHLYLNNRRMWDLHLYPQRNVSPVWKGVLKTSIIFKRGLKFNCGSGTSILFWKDHWIGDQPLELSFPSLYEIASNKEATVLSQYSNNSWSLAFAHLMSRSRSSSLRDLMDLLLKHQWRMGQDSISWKLSQSGEFTVKSLYANLKTGPNKDACSNIIWKTKVPLKVKVHLWLATKGASLTSDVLARRNIAQQFLCPLCSKETESAVHLFFKCDFSTKIWESHKASFKLPNLPPDLKATLTTWRRRKVSKVIEEDWDRKLAATFWIIWKERNDMLFQHISDNEDGLILRINRAASSWKSTPLAS